MKSPKSTSPSTHSDKRRFIVSVIFFLIACGLAAASIFSRQSSTPPPPEIVPRATFAPTLAARLTAIPAVLTGDVLAQIGQVQALLNDCPDYGDERRRQMQTHLAWLDDPTLIPADLLPAFGANPVGKLLFGMATYTSIEWRLAGRPADSCLLPIGRILNPLLAQMGETPYEEFE